MSKANRQRVYNKLVADGREDKISLALMDEFGPKEIPMIEPIVQEEVIITKPKKKGKKKWQTS